MRHFIDLIEHAAKAEIEESSVSRITQHIREGSPFVMISAMRHELDRTENNQRNHRLRHILNGLPVSYITTEGEYLEVGAERPSREASFFIIPYNHRSGEIPTDLLQRIGEKLMNTFDQDSIIFGDGEKIILIENDGSSFGIGDNTTFDPQQISKLPGFSKIKGRKFAFTPHPSKLRYAEQPRKPSIAL